MLETIAIIVIAVLAWFGLRGRKGFSFNAMDGSLLGCPDQIVVENSMPEKDDLEIIGLLKPDWWWSAFHLIDPVVRQKSTGKYFKLACFSTEFGDSTRLEEVTPKEEEAVIILPETLDFQRYARAIFISKTRLDKARIRIGEIQELNPDLSWHEAGEGWGTIVTETVAGMFADAFMCKMVSLAEELIRSLPSDEEPRAYAILRCLEISLFATEISPGPSDTYRRATLLFGKSSHLIGELSFLDNQDRDLTTAYNLAHLQFPSLTHEEFVEECKRL